MGDATEDVNIVSEVLDGENLVSMGVKGNFLRWTVDNFRRG